MAGEIRHPGEIAQWVMTSPAPRDRDEVERDAKAREVTPAGHTARAGRAAVRIRSGGGNKMSSIDVRGAVRLRGRADTDDPVLMSKVTVPEVPGWAVVRPRIEKLVADGARGSLTSVTGPPG